ncbi:related to ADH3-alcohol dehydrogenase III [Serendipita indica DSM 11827]|uniref:Related to ADH3-alcohol dehydrogenase III n=1 Tax=Serendipita indica (strain DSM 11827) TaxID=1109443 RepID=G4TP87_SERID|nr:related to ADH3-alcohol dehydrogenase III [Serendipita indica DSM 11827]
MAASMNFPKTHVAAVLSSLTSPLDFKFVNVTTPTTMPAGSALVRVLTSQVASYSKDVFTGKIPYPMCLPLTPGGGAIGRVELVGSDAVSLKPGQLVLVDICVRARDEPTVSMLQGLFAVGPGVTLMETEWRDGTYAEYVKAPLENLFPLDEHVLVGKLGYNINELAYISKLLVPAGSMHEAGVQPGETVIVAPATGAFGGAGQIVSSFHRLSNSPVAVSVALAMGARVVAAGRNRDQLKNLSETIGNLYGGRLTTVSLACDVEKDAEALKSATPGGKGADVYIDFSPPQASTSTHIASSLFALKPYGRAVFSGGITGQVSIPYQFMMLGNRKVIGSFMASRPAVHKLVGLVEAGSLVIGEKGGVKTVTFALEGLEEAFTVAAERTGLGQQVVVMP